jgi:K+-sensing histidine kinase KdpD
MGIGLSLCRSIIESHRGRIRAQNLYNGTLVVGCSFSFTLPVETTQRVDSANALSTFEAGVEPSANDNDS